jgi:uncharacterized membrane protein
VSRHRLDLPASQRTRRLLAALLAPAALATVIAMIVLWPARPHLSSAAGPPQVDGTVVSVGPSTALVKLDPGRIVTVDRPVGAGAPALRPGAGVVLLYSPDAVPGGRDYVVTDRQRTTPLIWLLALTGAAVLALGRLRGLSSLVGLAVSFLILLYFVIPALLDGSPPLLIAVVGASAIMFAALFLTHGVTVQTAVAIAGTLASLILTGVLGAAFTSALHLTGVAGEDDSLLSATLGPVDTRGLLLAGIVIGALGVLDDVTVTQAETVAELAAAGVASRRNLYRAAGRVGRAHVASAVNTIVLAYAGGSLPLLLLIAAGNQPLGSLLTGQFLTQEIMRSAVGTVGLVASVPITTALGVLVADVSASSGAAGAASSAAR